MSKTVKKPETLEVFADGSAIIQSATEEGKSYTMMAHKVGGVYRATECECEAGGHGVLCWHKVVFNDYLDKNGLPQSEAA